MVAVCVNFVSVFIVVCLCLYMCGLCMLFADGVMRGCISCMLYVRVFICVCICVCCLYVYLCVLCIYRRVQHTVNFVNVRNAYVVHVHST